MDESALKVLFVDDDRDILMAVRHLFDREQFKLLTATSGEEALELLRTVGDVAVMVSDQSMGGMSGIEFLEKAWLLSPHSVRMMLTGYNNPETARDAVVKGGAFRFITKPWKNEELLQTMRDAVTIYALMQENRRLSSIIEEMKKNA